MPDGHGNQIMRAAASAATALETWQRLMRTSGPNAALELTLSALRIAGQTGSILGPFKVPPWRRSGHLDARTRMAFFLLGISMLSTPAYFVRAVLHALDSRRHNDTRGHDLANQGLRQRLIGTEQHGRLFRVLAVLLALLSAIATYPHRTARKDIAIFQMLQPFPALLGRLFPTLPVFGLARNRRVSKPWLVAFAILALPASIGGAVAALHMAVVTQEQYEEHRKRWERWRGGITWGHPGENADEA